jgi:D-arabinose 5-phosphate isomerase GutQ
MQSDEMLALARDVFTRESASISALSNQLDERFVRVATLLFECSKRGHVLVAGSGTSHAVAARFAHLLSCCGVPALFIHPGDAQHGTSGAVTARDVVIGISKGGETTEVNTLARIAKSRGATIIGFTENMDGTLAKLSDEVLLIKAADNVDPYGMMALGSSLTVSAMCDALCTVLLTLTGYSVESFSETHPGGAVGLMIEGKK